ncbi:MAG TPA: methylthioribulose 1-phosphate dehydratase [Woeseiaceae bacterium]
MADKLCRLGRLFGERQWCLATSGNFSVRVDAAHCLITRSGTDKACLSHEDLMICNLDGLPADPTLKPSAETPLHTCLYRHDPAIGAVLHTHSVTTTVLSRVSKSSLELRGFEMQKAFDGVRSHDESLAIAIFDNSQDMPALAATVDRQLKDGTLAVPGFLVRGHGLYAWGKDLAAAQRHVEGLEFLLGCLWQARLARQ